METQDVYEAVGSTSDAESAKYDRAREMEADAEPQKLSKEIQGEYALRIQEVEDAQMALDSADYEYKTALDWLKTRRTKLADERGRLLKFKRENNIN